MGLGPSANPLRRAFDRVRRQGVAATLRRAFDSRVARPLLRDYVYPWQTARALRRMRRRNEVQRSIVPRAGTSPGRVLAIACVDTEGPNGFTDGGTWAVVEALVDRATSPAFRSEQGDSQGRPLILSWFVVDWVGEAGATRGLDIGHHRILDRYRPRIASARESGYADELHWHYHHVQPEGIDRWNRRWSHFPRFEEILSRRLLDRGVWPSVYRAGNTWEDDDCSAWLERFLPFDLSNRAPYRDLHYDWSRAPSEWILYHPDPRDFQRPGAQTRLMARSLGIEERAFSPEDVERAFLAAASGRDSYVSYYLHDYRPMAEQIAEAVGVLRGVGAGYPQVEWLHRGAAAALSELSGRVTAEPLRLTAKVSSEQARESAFAVHPETSEGTREKTSVLCLESASVLCLEIAVECNHPIHGEPWLAVQRDGVYARHDMRKDTGLCWTAVLEATGLEALAVAASDPAGQTDVLRLPVPAPSSQPQLDEGVHA